MCVLKYTRYNGFTAIGAVSVNILLDNEKGSPVLHSVS